MIEFIGEISEEDLAIVDKEIIEMIKSRALVRCKDCKNVCCHTYQNWQEPIYTCTHLRSKWNIDYDLEVNADDFCSFAERGTDESD